MVCMLELSCLAQASAEHGHSEMLKLLATDGPLKSIAKPINDAVEWVTGSSKSKDDAQADGEEDGGEEPEAKGAGLGSTQTCSRVTDACLRLDTGSSPMHVCTPVQ